MPDDKSPASKKKTTRNVAIVGVAALAVGIGYFLIRRGQSGSTGNTDTTGGVTGSGFTDMGDIIQTVQGPPGKTGATGKTGKTGASGDDDDDDRRRSSHPCPPGMRYDFAQRKCVPRGVFGKPKAGKRKTKGGPRGGGGGH